MQMGFYFDQTRCIGCCACRVACKDWYDLPAGEASRIRILYNEQGVWPDVHVSYMVITCFHCLDPVCIEACTVDAICKRPEDGIVTVDPEVCVGFDACDGKCLKACPYEVPQFGAEADAKMWKCDLCLQRLSDNKQAICVEACPTRALDIAPLDELKERYGEAELRRGRSGKVKQGGDFYYSLRTNPAVVINPKRYEVVPLG
jgi:anaerobic dimethyl sulfoxide reductase subunit B (iron-sulfur subunit)